MGTDHADEAALAPAGTLRLRRVVLRTQGRAWSSGGWSKGLTGLDSSGTIHLRTSGIEPRAGPGRPKRVRGRSR